jgi:hypothetical protein
MFKKTLLTASLFGLASASLGAELASDATHTNAIVAQAPSIQEVATLDDFTVTAPILHLGANYGSNDTIQITYSGASLDEDYTHPTTALTVVQTTGGTCTTANLSVSFAGLSGNVATYTVGASDGANTDCALTLPAVKVDGASLAAADTFSISVATSRGYGPLELIASTKLVDVGAAEITSTVSSVFNGTIDVNDDRETLTDGAATPSVELTDVATFVLADVGGGAALTATSTMTVTGDFSWAASTDAITGVVTYPQAVVTAATPANLGTVTKTATSISWIAAAADTYTLTLTPPTGANAVVLPATSFAYSSDIKYTNGTDAAVITEPVSDSAGAWSLNGASITALGVSNSTAVYPMIWIQNSGTSNGNISGSVNCAGVTITIPDLGTAAALSNTKVGEAIQTAVDADGRCPISNTRYDATVTVNAPASDITMNASYKVTAADGATDRVMLETSDSLPAASN